MIFYNLIHIKLLKYGVKELVIGNKHKKCIKLQLSRF